MRIRETAHAADEHSEQAALTVHTSFARLIADGTKTLELRSRAMLKTEQRVVICSSSPESLTLCLVECTEVFDVTDRALADVLSESCCTPQQYADYTAKYARVFAHRLRVVKQVEQRKVRGNFGIWKLRRSKHSRDAGYVL